MVRPGIVLREALVERMSATVVPVITVAAPPGYGKTTLMAQWAERIGSRVAWLSCDDGDNDPVVLLSALALALDRIGPVDPAVFSALASSGADITMVPRFVSAVASIQPPVTVVVDHAEAVTNRQCLTMIAEFALRLPPGWQLALASRTVVPLPTARLRAQGGILEVTADDLAMGPAEARSLLKGAGVEAGEAALRDLLQRTEGWPAGLYIAALAIKSGSRPSAVGLTFTGDDVYMGDYLRSELLDRISAAEASFLTRTSVLNRMCGPLCDAILGEQGSGAVLEQMEARNLLLVPLDRRREWYRYHHLLRDLLRSELLRREPDLVPDLHFRAAAWFEANAMPEMAIDHARAAGDYDRVARLILRAAAARLGQRTGRDSGALDGVAQGCHRSRVLRGDRRARLAALRAPRPASRGRALGRRRGACGPGRGSFQTAARWRPPSPTCARTCAAMASARCGGTRGPPGRG